MEYNTLKKISMGIVNQLYDLAEVPVEKRQAINDIADQYLLVQIMSLLDEEKYETKTE